MCAALSQLKAVCDFTVPACHPINYLHIMFILLMHLFLELSLLQSVHKLEYSDSNFVTSK